jgi:hypothetical protein
MNQIKYSKNISLNATPTFHHSILWTALMTPLFDGVEIAPTIYLLAIVTGYFNIRKTYLPSFFKLQGQSQLKKVYHQR